MPLDRQIIWPRGQYPQTNFQYSYTWEGVPTATTTIIDEVITAAGFSGCHERRVILANLAMQIVRER